MTLGQEWLQKIKFSLSHCAVEIVIASPQSVRRPWINFEAGAGWIRDVPVIPLCHSGMAPDHLPPPLNTFQAATATDAEQLELILPVLAKALKSGVPKIDFAAFVAQVKAYESDSCQREIIRTQSPTSEQDGLLPYEFETFVAIAELGDSPNEHVSVHRVREHLKRVRPISVSLALKMLERKELIILSHEADYYNQEPYYAVQISDPGWSWLQNNQDRLDHSLLPEESAKPKSDGSEYGDSIPF